MPLTEVRCTAALHPHDVPGLLVLAFVEALHDRESHPGRDADRGDVARFA
jgi:hypothetical protein